MYLWNKYLFFGRCSLNSLYAEELMQKNKAGGEKDGNKWCINIKTLSIMSRHNLILLSL